MNKFNLVFGKKDCFGKKQDKQFYRPSQYVSLADRGWEGEVEVLPPEPVERKNTGRLQGKKRRAARRKWQK